MMLLSLASYVLLESSVRMLLDPSTKAKNDILYNVTNVLKEQVGEGNLIDVGSGVEHQLGVSSTEVEQFTRFTLKSKVMKFIQLR
jgi:hypothetical protein